ncbi:diguanylate cyclase [Fusibacter sp. 3D3]|uniref:diguanylate cyclase n=1 Tax=Fusibacter sp. 3D3 TaxID=1048380 RepID=UPI001585F682|nr:diguanylate cyclase [Fusibacter sp. 3D3]
MKKVKIGDRYDYLYVVIGIIIIFLLTEFSFQYYSDAHDKSRNSELNQHAQKSAQLIQESIMRKIYVVDTLKIILELTDYNVAKFDDWAPRIYEVEPGISSVQLAPNGIVSFIYPLEGNEKAIGHNLLEDKNRDDGAKLAIETEELIFIGPITLIQNGKKAIIARRPIFTSQASKKIFWGFSIVVIEVEDIGFDDFVDEDEYHYRVLGNNPDYKEQSVIYEKGPYGGAFKSESTISVPGGQWVIQMSLKENPDFKMMHAVFYLVGMISAGLFSWFSVKKYKQALEIQNLNSELEKMNSEDALTGCHNRRYFEALAIRAQDRTIRDQTVMAIIMFDIDFFKHVNDQYGHSVGDMVLKKLAEIMADNVRASDDFARWGGEEFIILLPNTSDEEAIEIAEALRRKIENNIFDNDLKITASFGVTVYKSAESYVDLFKRVDSAVYLAKEKGRNQVVYLS